MRPTRLSTETVSPPLSPPQKKIRASLPAILRDFHKRIKPSLTNFQSCVFFFSTDLLSVLFHRGRGKALDSWHTPPVHLPTGGDAVIGATGLWSENLSHLEGFVQGMPPHQLFQEARFRFAFHLTTYDLSKFFWKQRAYCKSTFGTSLPRLARENHAFRPRIVDPFLLTSEARIYQLTHLASFIRETKTDLDNLRTVVEYGAGYGGTTELLTRVLPPDATVIVIDFPAMLRVQYHYLIECGLGDRLAFASRNSAGEIKKGMVNLVPLSYKECLASISHFKADLLIATWSLSEASAESQDSVIHQDFFGARRILYGHYSKDHALLPNTNSMSFPGFRTMFQGNCFFSADGAERYHFLERECGSKILPPTPVEDSK